MTKIFLIKNSFSMFLKGHCVVVFDEDGTYLRRIGSESVTNFPNGIDISDAGKKKNKFFFEKIFNCILKVM